MNSERLKLENFNILTYSKWHLLNFKIRNKSNYVWPTLLSSGSNQRDNLVDREEKKVCPPLIIGLLFHQYPASDTVYLLYWIPFQKVCPPMTIGLQCPQYPALDIVYLLYWIPFQKVCPPMIIGLLFHQYPASDTGTVQCTYTVSPFQNVCQPLTLLYSYREYLNK